MAVTANFQRHRIVDGLQSFEIRCQILHREILTGNTKLSSGADDINRELLWPLVAERQNVHLQEQANQEVP